MTTQSPILIGRSHRMVMPAARLPTMFCRPKPTPNESAPAMMVMLLRLPPITATAIRAETMNPRKLIEETSELRTPLSMSILLKLPRTKLFFNSPNRESSTKKQTIPRMIEVMEM